jgi:hypothetical protein
MAMILRASRRYLKPRVIAAHFHQKTPDTQAVISSLLSRPFKVLRSNRKAVWTFLQIHKLEPY